MSTKPSDVTPEMGDAEKAAQHFNALRRSFAAGDNIDIDEFASAFRDLANADCETDRDALALLAYARFTHEAGSELVPEDMGQAVRTMQEGQLLVSRALEYLERKTGVSAWDFLAPEERAKIQ